jgi:hypothetical protein
MFFRMINWASSIPSFGVEETGGLREHEDDMDIDDSAAEEDINPRCYVLEAWRTRYGFVLITSEFSNLLNNSTLKVHVFK